MVDTAMRANDVPGMLRWESRLEELLLSLDKTKHPELILGFAVANYRQGLFAKAATLLQRVVQVLGKLERFSDQGGNMCKVGECFLILDDAKGAETWYQKARTLGEKHGCCGSEGRASLGLGRVEIYMRGRMQEGEELLRHALSVLDFVEGKNENLEREITQELAKVLLHTDRYKEAEPLVLIQRLCELAEEAGAHPLDRVEALELAVELQVARGDSAQAWPELQVLPSDPISHFTPSDSRKPDLISHLSHTP
jgi:hypothetical protein